MFAEPSPAPIAPVYSIQTMAERKYFRTEKEARDYRRAIPEDSLREFSKLARTALFENANHEYYVKGEYEMPVYIRLEPSKVSSTLEPWHGGQWFEL